jgi:hypothetical protein
MSRYNFKVLDLVFAAPMIGAIFVGFASNSWAAQGDVSEYQINLKKVELCTSKYCTDTFVVSTDQKAIDLSQASAGAAAGNMAITTKPKVGKIYTHVGLTMSRTFQVTGVSSESDCVTTISGSIGAFASGDDGVNTAGGAASSTAGASSISMFIHSSAAYGSNLGLEANWGNLTNAAALTWVGGSETTAADVRVVYALTASYTVSNQPPEITVTIDTQNTIFDGSGGNNCGDGAVDADQAVLFITDPIVNLTIK